MSNIWDGELNMKFRVLPLLLVVIALFSSACTLLANYYIDVIGVSGDGCTISVSIFKEELKNFELHGVFIRDPYFRTAYFLERLYDVSENDEFTILDNDSVEFHGKFNVEQYTYSNGKWYFQINGNGRRTAALVESFFAGLSDLHSQDITDVGWIWLDGTYVREFVPPLLRCNETDELINVEEPAGESVNRLYLCEVGLTLPVVPARVGPGEDRAIRAYIENTSEGYPVSGYFEDDDGSLWYELLVPNLGNLWILASQTTTVGYGFIRDEVADDTILSDCTSGGGIPHKSDPVIVNAAPDNQESENISCEGFALVSPSGNIPTGNTKFEWTAVEGADEYLVMFYNYGGAFAARYSVATNSLSINTGDIPTGSQLSWEVYAMQNGEIFCRTNRSATLTRLAHEIIIVETEEPTPKPKKKNKGGGGYTPPSE